MNTKLSVPLLLLVWCYPAAVCLAGDSVDYDARARDVVSHLTLDEKISQMHGTKTPDAYRIVVGIPAKGVPDLYVTNGPAGMGPAGPGHQGKATALPAPIALAATWDLEASREYGLVAATEALDYGNTFLEAPDVNIARNPQNGRSFEAFGEDPFLVGRLAVANIEGIQSQHILGNVKHFAANNQENHRRLVSAEVDERTLHEIYLPAFEASIKEGKVASVMGAYNKFNGAYCCENDLLLNQILKKDWGFQGFVSSDFGAVHSTVATITNGLDLEMPDGKYLGADLKAAVLAGKVPESVIDEHLVRRFRTMMQYGVWDTMPAKKPLPAKEDGAIARQIAEEGVVLLRNDVNLLPLTPTSLKSVVLIGPYAVTTLTGGTGSSLVDPLYSVSPLEGMQKRLGSSVKLAALDGKDLPAAVAAAKAADVAILMVGYRQGEGRDNTCLLDQGQDELVTSVLSANPKTVVVLMTGSALIMPWADRAHALLEAWYAGEEEGNVVADVLFGDRNPSGKLPLTFPKALADVPAHTVDQYPGTGPEQQFVEHYSEGVMVGYRWYDSQRIEPLFPFGYGLSYTTFGYGHLALSAKTLSGSSPALTVDFDITNTGSRAGTEIGQVYVAIPAQPNVPQPPRQLKGFVRLSIEPGKTAHAHVTMDARAFSYWDVTTHGWKIAPGTYQIEVGASSRDIKLSDSVQVR